MSGRRSTGLKASGLRLCSQAVEDSKLKVEGGSEDAELCGDDLMPHAKYSLSAAEVPKMNVSGFSILVGWNVSGEQMIV